MTRIALISDIHFGKHSTTRDFAVPGEPIVDETAGACPIKESLVAILRENDVQYLFIAGDLTSVGSPQECYYCEQTILEIARNAGISQDNIFSGLGNHDMDWLISGIYDERIASQKGHSRALASGFPKDIVKEMYRTIAAYAPKYNMPTLFREEYKDGPAPFSGIIENDNFILFVLNSGWHCTNDQSIKHGKLDNGQLSWFKQYAERLKDDARWKILLMHHHPFSYEDLISNHDISMVEEGSAIQEIAGKNGINLILHGHRHHPKAKTRKDSDWISPVTFICAGSLAANSHNRAFGRIPNTVHIIELTHEKGVLKLINFQYSITDGWIPMNNTPETPLDHEMYFGKIYFPEDFSSAIALLQPNQKICYANISDCLRFLSYKELNHRIKNQLSGNYNVVGEFPQDIFLLPKGPCSES